jgi:hypothetical protein
LEQDVAVKRHDELKQAMATADFAKHPPEWQNLFVQEYEAMRQAGGIQTVQEQQQAQQAQMQQQQEAAMAQKGPQADPAQEQAQKQAEMQQQQQMAEQQMAAQQQQKQVELEHSAGQAEAERQHKLQLAAMQAQQAEADRQVKLQMQANEHAVKQRELDQPIEVAQAQAKEITGGILPVVQQAVAGAVEQAVSHLTLLHQESAAQTHQIVAAATEPLAHELLQQRHTLISLAQAVQQPVIVKDDKQDKKEAVNVTVEMPKPKKRTVRLKKGADGSITGEVDAEGEGTQTIKLHRDEKGELVGDVTTASKVKADMKSVRRKGK